MRLVGQNGDGLGKAEFYFCDRNAVLLAFVAIASIPIESCNGSAHLTILHKCIYNVDGGVKPLGPIRSSGLSIFDLLLRLMPPPSAASAWLRKP